MKYLCEKLRGILMATQRFTSFIMHIAKVNFVLLIPTSTIYVELALCALEVIHYNFLLSTTILLQNNSRRNARGCA